MQDQNFGYGMPTVDERLQSIRQPQQPLTAIPGSSNKKKWRSEILLGVAVVALLLCVAFLFTRRSTPVANELSPIVAATVTVAPQTVDGLLDGEALIGVNLEVGNFPMELAEGDIVRVVVTPSLSDSAEARELAPTVQVTAIEAIGEFTGRFAVTLLGAREVATAIATSGPVHLTIVKKGVAK